MRRPIGVLVVFVGLALTSGAAQQGAAPDVAKLLQDPAVKAALDWIPGAEARVLEDQVELTEIPAPGFKEGPRGEAIRKKFVEAGLENVRVDRAGNVLGERPGAAARPAVVIAAHLDTVFPEGTDVRVKREGAVLRAPGIGDDGRGLAVLLGVARAMVHANVRTPGTVIFVANVGEEGLSDLRGVKQLFNDTLKGRVDAFVSVDGTGHDVTHVGVGSHRYRVTFRGPGGHSFGAFGLVNPVHALGRAVARIAAFEVPAQPKVTFNVGRIGGGTSVNSIAYEAWFEIDMRSSDSAALGSIDASFQDAVDRAVREEQERWNNGRLTVDQGPRGRPPGRPDAGERADRPDRGRAEQGHGTAPRSQRGLHRFEHPDEPRDSGDHRRRRRPGDRRALPRGGVRQHGLVEGDAADPGAGRCARPVVLDDHALLHPRLSQLRGRAVVAGRARTAVP